LRVDPKEDSIVKPARPPRTLGLLVGAGALALPALAAGAPASPALRATPARSVTYSGKTVPAHQWGTVTVNVTVQSGGPGRKFSDLGGGYTYHTSRSQFIMSQALPILRQEFLAAQSARIHLVSGATYTSQAFVQSLQSALLKAHA
jgi:uncharacterized protein with FMN-binding domain